MFKKILKKILPGWLQKKISLFLIWLEKQRKLGEAEKLGISFLPPEYIFIDKFGPESLLVDVGCGFDADFSMAMINKFGLKSIGIDPTAKHAESLAELSAKTEGKFQHKPWAVSFRDGEIEFNESRDNVSGSIFADHKNIKGKQSRQYKVEAVSLARLPERLALPKIDLLKLDLEGAEYDIIKNLKENDLAKFDQIFLEFHHDYLPQYSMRDTLECILKLESLGFRSFSIDKRNFLFYAK